MKNLNTSLVLFVLLILSYLLITFLIPTDPASLERYNISEFVARLIGLSFSIPGILIWSAAFYGYSKVHQYALTIEGDRDGEAFNTLATGLGFLAFSLPINTIISTLLGYYAMLHPESVEITGASIRYTEAILSLLAFILIYRGAVQISQILKINKLPNSVFVFMGTLLLGIVFSYFSYINPPGFTEMVNGQERLTTFGLIIFIIRMLIKVITWYLAIQSAVLINTYSLQVKGEIYKRALNFLVKGFYMVTFSSIFVQGLTVVQFGLEEQNLGVILIVIYLILALIAIGYVLIALGAKNLNKLEQV